jgi:hypothetical protein
MDSKQAPLKDCRWHAQCSTPGEPRHLARHLSKCRLPYLEVEVDPDTGDVDILRYTTSTISAIR